MKKYFKLYFILVVILYQINSITAQTIWTVGPMIHLNIGDKKVRMSYNLEFAYWNFSKFPRSYDFALEFEKSKIRLYCELQTGIGVAGVSAGPVFELQTDKPAFRGGFQGSVWANYYLGFDFRMRFIDQKKFFSPGIYVKGGFNPRDKNGNKIEHNNSDWSGFDD